MPGGLFGDDFDSTQPADNSLVKLGASWIRDLKGRLKRFAQIMFNLETGDFRDNVVRSDSLTDSGVAAGTYNRVTVNSKGLVTAAENEDEDVVASYFVARYEAAGAEIDTETDVTSDTGDGGTYTGSGAPYQGTYATLNGSSYKIYSLTVPDGVRRMKAVVVGGGGGSSSVVPGFSVFSNAAKAVTTTTGTWGWIAVGPGYVYPITTLPAFAQAFRVKTVAVDDAEKLSFDNGAGGSVSTYMLPGLKLRNTRTNEVIRVVSLDTGTTWITERAQDGTSIAAVLDNDEWEAQVAYGGGGGESVEGTIPITPGETIAIVVGLGGAENGNGAPSSVASGAAHLEAGGGEKGTSGGGGGSVTGTKSTNVGYLNSTGSAGALMTGGRSGSNIGVTANLWHGDGGQDPDHPGQDGVVILEWVA